MGLKITDRIKHKESGATVVVLKTYKKMDSEEEWVQAFNDQGIIYDRIENFIPLDCMLLKCNNCDKEEYEVNIKVNDKFMYECKCGSSTFTPLNLDEVNNY